MSRQFCYLGFLKVLAYELVCLLLINVSVNAQSWQWGKRAGSYSGPVSAGYDETTYDIATDANGNVYVVSELWTPGLDIDGHARSGYGGADVVLSSFKCDGTYRWSKIIGGHQSDVPASVKTDTLGGVYVSGYLITNSSACWIDADSSWAGGVYKTLFLAKFDTSGTYKWFRMPQPDTISATSSGQSATYDLDVDKAGNIYWLCKLTPGIFAGGSYLITTQSIHMLKYNRDGYFMGGTLMQMSYSGGSSPFYTMKRDHRNGRVYVTGTRPFTTTITFGSTTIAHPLYLACFDGTGTCLWTRENTNNLSNGPLCRPALDADGKIYVTAQAVNGDNFNSYSVTSLLGPYGAPMVVKLDSAGNHIWGTNGQTDAVTRVTGIVVNGSEVAMTGSYPRKLIWNDDTLRHAGSCGYSPFAARLNATTGALIYLDSLQSTCGDNAHPICIAADKGGSFYISGYVNQSVTVNGTTLTKVGGGSDIFLAKYGSAACGCTLPSASFTSTGTHTVNFTYTGTSAYDSVRWDFGDGGTSALAAPTHVYVAAGTYTVCVTVYTACGSDMHCQVVTVITGGVGIPIQGFETVNIYPNPVSEELIVDGVTEGTSISIYSMVGRELYSDIATGNRYQLNTQTLPPGAYIIQLIDRKGYRMKRTFVKQ